MGAMDVVLLVLGILAVVASVLMLALIPISRRLKTIAGEMERELAASGERVIVAPEQAVYRGATSGYGRVKGNGIVALTDQRVVFRKVIGDPVEIHVDQIAGVRTEKWFLRAYGSGQPVVVLTTRSGVEVGFIFADPVAWTARLRALEGVAHSP